MSDVSCRLPVAVVSVLALLLVGVPAAGNVVADPESDSGRQSVYRIRPSEDLKSIFVEMQLEPGADELRARDGDVERLEDLRGCADEEVQLKAGRIMAGATNGCLRYRYPLTPQSGRRSPPVAEGVVVTAPSEWLWTPELEGRAPIRIELSLPTAIQASVPWRQVGKSSFELTSSPGSATGSVVLGSIDVLSLPVAGVQLRVATVDGPDSRLDRQKVLQWLGAAAADVAGVAGQFPNPDVQIIVQPVDAGRSRSAVPFGYVIRDGGETVRFFVDAHRPLADYLQDWTATHEFSHLLLPYVRSREKWVSEGFASYYQNVLLARRGTYSETEAWSRLHRSFQRAAEVPDPPRLDRLGQRSFWEMRMLIYWAGAAMALRADAELREASGGVASLDTVLARLASCCLPSGRVWTARELFEKLDSLSPEPVFLDLYQELMAGRGMPDLAPLYRDLGLEVSGGQLRLGSDGRLVAVRNAIMAPKERR